MLNSVYAELYSDETFNNTMWGDTFELAKTKKYNVRG